MRSPNARSYYSSQVDDRSGPNLSSWWLVHHSADDFLHDGSGLPCDIGTGNMEDVGHAPYGIINCQVDDPLLSSGYKTISSGSSGRGRSAIQVESL